MTHARYTKQDYDYASNRAVAKIRHQETPYDGFDVFFHENIRHRQRLNRLCGKKYRKQIEADEFATECHVIMSDVNLYNKRNQKRFVRARRAELYEELPFATEHYVKQVAEHQLWRILKRQNKRNEQKNMRHNNQIRCYVENNTIES